MVALLKMPAQPPMTSETRAFANAGSALANTDSAFANAGSAFANAGSAFANAGSAVTNAGSAVTNTGCASAPRLGLKLAGAERRMFPRKAVSAAVEGTRIGHSPLALRGRRLSLAVRDLSLGGLSAISDAPLRRGERLRVSFPPQGLRIDPGGFRGGWGAVGRVVRCEPSGLGYRVAVEFDAVPAAA